jgi:hypothetical protein
MQEPSHWTTTGVFRASVADISRHPVAIFLLIGVLPGLWGWPVDLIFPPLPDGRLSPDALHFAGKLARVVWDSAFLGGAFLVALHVARGGSPRLSDLFRGPRFVFRVAILSLFTVLPGQLLFFVRGAHLAGAETAILSAVAATVASAILIRCSLSVQLVVDAGSGVWRAVTASWAATGGYSWRIARVYLLSLLFVIPASLAFRAPPAGRMISALVGPVMTLVLAHVYLLINPSVHSSNVATTDVPSAVLPVVPNDDLPVRGSGWSRAVTRKPS